MTGEEQLRSILPHLRPRSAEPTLFSQTVWYLLWAGISLLLALYVHRFLAHRRRRREEFYAVGREGGLTEKQTSILFDLAKQRRMRTPIRLLQSAHVFDRQVGALAAELARRDRSHPRLAVLGDIRTALGFDALPPDQALGSTRQLQRGQTVIVQTDVEIDAYVPWLVLDRDEGTLTLAPVLREGGTVEAGPRCRAGDKLTARFWREGDTEYTFTTVVVDGADTKGAILVEHAPVKRLQQRDFYRIDVAFPVGFRVVSNAKTDPDAVDEVAAVDLLWAQDAGQVPPASDGDPDDDGPRVEPSTAADPPRTTPLVSGQAVNLSAGGLAVEVPGDLPETSRDAVWIVDPAFEGPFPLAGLHCRPVGTEPAVGGVRVKLRFEDLPPALEKEIVRGIYQHQLLLATGHDPAAPAATVPDGDAEDDLPTP